MSPKADRMERTGRSTRSGSSSTTSKGGRRSPSRMEQPQRRYMLLTLFAVLVAIIVLLVILIVVAPGEVADAGLRGTGMIWGLLVLKGVAAAMIFTWFMFMTYRDKKEVKQ